VSITDQLQELTKPAAVQSQGGTNNFQFIFDNLPREAATAVKGLSRLTASEREELRRIAQAKAVEPTGEAKVTALLSQHAGSASNGARSASSDEGDY
jgi:hypothetical protein